MELRERPRGFHSSLCQFPNIHPFTPGNLIALRLLSSVAWLVCWPPDSYITEKKSFFLFANQAVV